MGAVFSAWEHQNFAASYNGLYAIFGLMLSASDLNY